MLIQSNNAVNSTSVLFKEILISSFTSLQKKIIAVAAIAFASLAVFLTLRHCWLASQRPNLKQDQEPERLQQDQHHLTPDCEMTPEPIKEDTPILKVDSPILEKDQRLEPNWINNHPDVSLRDLGIYQVHEVEEFLTKHGKELNALNLKGIDVDDDQFQQLIQYCPNLHHLSIKFAKISDKALEHLKGMALTSVDFGACDDLTDQALEHLKGMPLTSVDFNGCYKLTDQALEHLKGMPLTSVDFARCFITDKALEHLKGMQLTGVNFRSCYELTDQALEHLKGMPLTSVDFAWCFITDKAFEHLKGMQLTSVDFGACEDLTDQALEYLKGMPLTSVNFRNCKNLTDQALEHLKGMPLTFVDFSLCQKITDPALVSLQKKDEHIIQH